jgi:hypothetical protein
MPSVFSPRSRIATGFGLHESALIGAEDITLRKLIAPGKRPAGVDQHAPHGQIAALAPGMRNSGIEIRSPGVVKDIDGRRRIDPRAHRPQDFIQVGRIDIFIHRDIVSLHVALAKTGGGDERLLGVAGVTLAVQPCN